MAENNTDKNKKKKSFEDVASTAIKNASKLPLVKVNREEFLRKEFGDSPYIDKILKDGPPSVFTIETLEERAKQIIKGSTKKTTVNSFLAGLPSNPAAAIASAGIDVTQYFGFAINLAQKISYLFGVKDLGGVNSEEAEADITIILGVMLGVDGARIAFAKRATEAGLVVGKRVASRALTKTTVWYPAIKKILHKIGIEITKKTVKTTIADSFSVVGATVSGGMTWLSFRPLGGRLAQVYVDLHNGKYSTEMELNQAFEEKFNSKSEEEADAIDVEFEELKDTEYDLSKLRDLTIEADTRYAEFRKDMSKLIDASLEERALEAALEAEGKECKIKSIGENEKYIVVTMSNDELDRFNDGFSFPTYVVNKDTGKEKLDYAAGFLQDPDYDDLVMNEIEFQMFD